MARSNVNQCQVVTREVTRLCPTGAKFVAAPRE